MDGSEGSLYNYVVTAYRPTAVNLSAVGNFTSATDLNLIISKFTRIEIHTLTPEGLQGIVDVPVYGRIAALTLYRPKGANKDLLIFVTEHYKLCVVGWNGEQGQLVTLANGNMEDRVGRPVDAGLMGLVDPASRMIGLHMYTGCFKVVPLNPEGHPGEAFNVRLEELTVVDMAFLEGCAVPTVALIYQDTRAHRHIKTYEVSVKEKELLDGPWSHSNLDEGAALVIAVPAPRGGALVVGEKTISYFAAGQPMKACHVDSAMVRAYGRVDEDGSRWLLGARDGTLHMLVLAHDGEQVVSLTLEKLGRTSAASTLAYLDSGVVFVGSQFGDSQLVRLHPEAPNPAEPANFVEVLERWTNLGPIVDMAVVDLERQGQGQVVTCSGVDAEGSLRIVRNGIGVIEQAAAELPGIKGIWSLRARSADEHDKYLVLTFVGETRVLAISADDELNEAEIPGLDADAQTLYCGNVDGDALVQVTPGGVRLLDAVSGQQKHSWQPSSGMQVNVAAANATQVILATGQGNVVCLEVSSAGIKEAGHAKIPAEIACVDITPLGEPGAHAAAQLAVAGTWDQRLLLFRVPGLQQVQAEELGGQVIPRSVLLAQFEGVPYLLCALGDGNLVSYVLRPSSGELTERRKLSLGVKPIMLRAFKRAGVTHVFAASDRPTVIHSSDKKLLYSNVNEDEVNYMTSFNSAAFPDALAIAKEGTMVIGSIDEIQKLHIRTVPLGEQPRRLAHQEATRSFIVAISKGIDGLDALRLVDDATFETTARFTLEQHELICSAASLLLADDLTPYYVVGTALVIPNETEPSKGRLLVFDVRESKLQLVAEREVKGAVYQVCSFRGMILTGINSRVQLFQWNTTKAGSHELVPGAGLTGFVLAMYLAVRGDFIIVGDLMRSVTLLLYKPEEGKLEKRATDYASNWMTAVAVLDDDTFLGAENNYNLFTLRKNGDAATDDERARLEEVGCFGLGEFVNRIRHGSLVMKLPDSEAANIPTLLFGTINGVVGVIASLPAQQFRFLEKLQDCLRGVVRGIGGLDHLEWRHFSNARVRRPARNFVDGDLIEQYLDLDRDAQHQVAAAMNNGITAEDLVKQVEELSRLH